MLILLITWSIFLLLCLIVSQWLRIESKDLFIRFFIGIAVLSVYLQLWAIVLPVKYSLIPLILLFIYSSSRKRIREKLKTSFKQFLDHVNVQSILILLSLLFIASMPAYFNDDGAYYQQTIQWFSEYGYVKGLANINIHLGLGSAWHLISSAFYFEELPLTRYYNFNGLVLWVLIMSLLKRQSAKFRLITVTVLLFLGYLFVNAPSPDLIIMAGTVWILLNIRTIKPVHLAVIIGFLITVKITAAGLILFFLPLYTRLNSGRELAQVVGALTIFGLLLIIRNTILTGYPLFPSIFTGGYGEHQVPELIIQMFRENVVLEIFDKFHLDVAGQYDLIHNYWDRLQALLVVRKYKAIMNLLCVMAFIIMPYLLMKKRRTIDILLAIGILLNGLLWFWQAPNYRFVLGYVIFAFYLLSANLIPLNSFIFRLKNVLFAIVLAAAVMLSFRFNDVLYILNCGEKKDLNLHLVFYPAFFNEFAYKTENGFHKPECAYCFDTPVPCYSEPVMNNYVRRFNFDVVPKDQENISEGFVMKKVTSSNISQ